MKNKKVLNEIATLYNQNSLAKAYYFRIEDDDNFKECSSACSTLIELLDNLGCKYDREYTTKKVESVVADFWEMTILI